MENFIFQFFNRNNYTNVYIETKLLYMIIPELVLNPVTVDPIKNETYFAYLLCFFKDQFNGNQNIFSLSKL